MRCDIKMDTCAHCKADLNAGDIFQVLKSQKNDTTDEAIEHDASLYGWTKENKKQFSRRIIVQPVNGPQYVMCPDCENVLTG